MSHSKLLVTLLMLILLTVMAIPFPGCDSSNDDISPTGPGTPAETTIAPSQPNGTPAASTTMPSQSGNAPSPTFVMDVSFPDGAPPLNQTAKLRVTLKTRFIPMNAITLKANLPDALELISGDLSWNGNVPADAEIAVIEAVVKSVKVGNCTINVNGHINHEENHGSGGDLSSPVYLSISEDSAQWRITLPYDAPSGGPEGVPVTPVEGNTRYLPSTLPTSTQEFGRVGRQEISTFE